MARIGETRHFLPGIGYVFYGSRKEEVGGFVESVTGWFVERTPKGRAEAHTFAAKHLGNSRDEVAIAHPDIAKAMKREGVQGW